MTSALTLHEHWARISRDAWTIVITAGDTDAAVIIQDAWIQNRLCVEDPARSECRAPGFRVAASGWRLAAVGC